MELPFTFFGAQHGANDVPAQWRLLGYGAGLVTAVSAISLHLWLQHVGVPHHPLMIFAFALVFSGWLFGFGPSVLTGALCGLAAAFFLSLNLFTAEGLLGLSLYVLICLGICLIVGRQRLTRLALERTVSDLNIANEQAESARARAERDSEAKEQFLRLIESITNS